MKLFDKENAEFKIFTALAYDKQTGMFIEGALVKIGEYELLFLRMYKYH